MAFVPYANRKSRPWRDFLTYKEIEKLAEIEAEIANLDNLLKRRRTLARDRLLIVNRAAARAKLQQAA